MAGHLWKILGLATRAGIIASFAAMMISVLIQVFARFFLESAPSWTEEMARIFFVFSVAFGAGLAVKEGAYIFLDSLIHWFKPGLKRIIDLFSKIAVLLVSAVMLWYSFDFVAIGTLETSPAMNINMGYVFASMSVMGIMIGIYVVIDIFKKNRAKG